MIDMKVFHGVTPSIFNCLKTTSERDHGTKYDPPDGNKGTSTTSTNMYEVVLGFDFNPGNGDLTYTVVKKSWDRTDRPTVVRYCRCDKLLSERKLGLFSRFLPGARLDIYDDNKRAIALE